MIINTFKKNSIINLSNIKSLDNISVKNFVLPTIPDHFCYKVITLIKL